MGQTLAKTSAEKKQLGERKMKKRKSDASHEKREEEEGEEEEEEELRLPPLPSTRLSKEALIDKFKNFEDMKVRPPSSSRDDDDIERGELKMDFNKVPEILKDFDRGGKTAATPTMDSLDFSSDSDDENEVLEKKSKGKEEEKEEDGNDDDDKDISFEEKLLSNAADDRSGKLRNAGRYCTQRGESPEKARAERRCSRTRKRN